KDALSILNGTHFMAGAASLLLHDARRLLLTADVVAALSLEALRGSRTAFDPRIHAVRPHPGQVASAARIFALTEGSGIAESHVLCDRVQDAYSLRCAAQVHGACADAIDYLRRVLDIELNAGTDNPLVFASEEAVLSGGNFHGEPLALALDTAAIGLSELGSISERRLFRMLTGFLSELPPFLTRHSGLDSGYMLLQYTAAALATDNQLLAMPASVHSLPTSADQEDHNSMGWHSAQQARQVATNVEAILALEALGAAQGIDLLSPLRPGTLTAEAHAAIREKVPPLDHDRVLQPEIEAAIELVHSGKLAKVSQSGALNSSMTISTPIRAARGTQLSTRGWQQEAALRMLCNNLDPEVAERPEDLVVYGGTGKAARDWPAFHAIVAALQRLKDDETLLVQSGKAVGVFRTHEYAPRVLIANSLLVPHWATWDTFWEL